jgi:acyl-CoA:acyl-CoA alkyltransferase
MIKVKIAEISSYLPPNRMSNEGLEGILNANGEMIPPGLIARLFGSKERRYAAPEVQVSDLATEAARPIVEKYGANHIDYLIFAAASCDMLEPATANMVQTKLGLSCPVFDLKNACNGFLSGIQVGSALIQSGQYKTVLVVNGEKLQDAVKFKIKNAEELKTHLAAYTLGDAAGAVLLEKSDDESGIVYQKFKTEGKHWELCMVPGGGSFFPHDDKNYFEGKPSEMRGVFFSSFSNMFVECFQETGWQLEDVKYFFMHQVSVDTFDAVSRKCGLPRERFLHSFQQYGNIAAASIPVNLHEAVLSGKIQKGDKLMFVGLGAGISIGIQMIIW